VERKALEIQFRNGVGPPVSNKALSILRNTTFTFTEFPLYLTIALAKSKLNQFDFL
jgi:hypothetical protein